MGHLFPPRNSWEVATANLSALALRFLLAVVFLGLFGVIQTPVGATASTAASERSVVLAFYPEDPSIVRSSEERNQSRDEVLDELAGFPGLAVGWLSAAQASYFDRQARLDMTAGIRLATTAYPTPDVPEYSLAQANGRWHIAGWEEVRRRAGGAPANIKPGLLAQTLMGNAAYVGVGHGSTAVDGGSLDAVIAADQTGGIRAVSLGSEATLLQRVELQSRKTKLTVVTLPWGKRGHRLIGELVANRRSDQLVIVMRQPPVPAHRYLPFGIAGLPGANGSALASRTVRREGFAAAIDLPPTILKFLHVPIPYNMTGKPITVGRTVDLDSLQQQRIRWAVTKTRCDPALKVTLIAALVLATLLTVVGGRSRLRAGLRRGLRVGALTMLWFPAMTLLTAVLTPTYWAELVTIAVGGCVMALLTDRVLRWPLGPLAPALTAVGVYLIDLFNNSNLIVNSLLGPNPYGGTRFFGFGNQLEATVPALMMVGLAAALTRMPRSPKLAGAFGVPMLILTVLMASGRLGAAVGAVFTAGVGASVAVLWCRRARPSWLAYLSIGLVPCLLLGLLAVIDLNTGADAHFTHSVMAVDDPPELIQIVTRRLGLSWHELWRGSTPRVAGSAVFVTIIGICFRRFLYSPVKGLTSWNAGLIGCIVAGVIGSLANDSGPWPMIYVTAVLIAATVYIQGCPGVSSESQETTTFLREMDAPARPTHGHCASVPTLD